MEENGMSEAASEKAKEKARLTRVEVDYKDPENSQDPEWKCRAASYYCNVLTETEQKEFLEVPMSELGHFCSEHLCSLWLPDMLADWLLFFKFYSTWEVSICPHPKCFSFFTQHHHSLIPHLMRHHLNVQPILLHNPAEEQWCAKTLGCTVWKPIDVEGALDMLSTISLDAGHFGSLEWPLSEDFSRGQLLTELQKGVEVLLGSQESEMVSNSFLRALIVVASDYILRYLDPACIMPLPFRSLFYCSALSFCFMENESLSCFVNLVTEICKLVQEQAFQSSDLEGSKDGDVRWSKGEYLDAVSIPDGCDYLVLDTAKLKLCDGGKDRIASWLCEAPIFPTIPQLPSRVSEILKLLEIKTASFSEHLATSGMEFDFRSAELVSWFKLCSTTTCLPIPGTTCVELPSNDEQHPANSDHMLYPSSHSDTNPTKCRRIESAFVMMQQRLELVKLTFELQLLELRVRQVCAVDLRMYILPLLRSFLRMRLHIYMEMGWVPGPEDAEEVDTHSGHLIEGSQEEHTEDHVRSKFKGEPGSENDKDMATPYLGTCKIVEQSSSTPLELWSSGNTANWVSELDHVMIDGGKLLGTTGGARTDIMCPISNVDTAFSDSRIGIATVSVGSEAEPDAMPVSNSLNERTDEPYSQCLQEVKYGLYSEWEMTSDSDTIPECIDDIGSNSDSETSGQNAVNMISPDLDWFVRERKTWETKDNGIFFRIGISDIVNHCLEGCQGRAAQSMWRLKINRTQQYWYCFTCEESFPDQASHMMHMESEHQLGLSCDLYCLVPSQYWQKDLSVSGTNGEIKERTQTLDDFLEVDHTHGIFLVDISKIGIIFQNEEHEQPSVQMRDQFAEKVGAIQHQISCLGFLFNTKGKLCGTAEVSELDAAILQNLAQLKKLKQDLSELCVFDYKNEILSSIRSFLQDKFPIAFSDLGSWACNRLKDLLGSVRCPFLPDSFFTVLETTGKVVVNIQERYASVGFAYTRLCWRFGGDVLYKKKRSIKGSFIYAGVSWGPGSFHYDSKVIPDNCKLTSNIRVRAAIHFAWDVHQKLEKFQQEFVRKLQG